MHIRSLTVPVLTLALGLVALLFATGARAACPSAELYSPLLDLPHAQAAFHAGRPIVIVAFGSSSTAGFEASNPAHNYPAILQADLSEALKGAEVSVLNRGIGGQDANDEEKRLDRDAIAVRPDLILWQVGGNAVLRGTPAAAFRLQVESGLRRMRTAGIDTVLIDNQRSPRIIANPHHVELEEMLASVADEEGVSFFSRGRMMDEWAEAGAPYLDFVASDGLHHNDLGYRCFADALARSIAHAVLGRPAVAAATGAVRP
jgi:lysophospholipase L1-like esterase